MTLDITRLTLGQLLTSEDITIKRNAMSILKVIQKCDHKKEHGRCIYCLQETQQEFFPITSVGRADLEGIGYDISNVSDATMERLASKMADAYCENSYWIDLEILADSAGIPKKSK